MSTVIQGDFQQEIENKYLTYALSTIMSRALPDVRDGLKPVHRRLLYAMRMLKLDPEKGYKKCARVVGDVIGKYHPHGDGAVYDAMVRLAQDFSVRYELVDGQGNFGNIDGDSAAAMRYTEARMTKAAKWLMKDLDNGTVDFIDNYDETEKEPQVMPACFPNLLANGATGIAVGLATSIPPHNVGEICDALLAQLKKPSIPATELIQFIQAPDLPTGGIIADTEESILKCYETGKGSLRVRARWATEDLGRGQYQIVVTEIPYQVQKSRLIEKIADLIYEKKLPWLADIRDESDEQVRIVLEPKNRTVDAEQLMETMFKYTDLESRISFNMNALNSLGQPELMGLKRILGEFIKHRTDVLLRKSKWRIDKIEKRLHILKAYQVVYLNIDEVIEIIKTEDQPAVVMMSRFNIDEVQAEAILNMRLRSLRKLEEMEIKREFDQLSEELSYLNALLGDEAMQRKELRTEFKEIRKEFADERRTSIEGAPTAEIIPIEAQMEKEPITVLISKQGWIKANKGHMDATQEVKYKDGDEEAFRFHAYTTDNVCVMSDKGRVYTLPANKLPAGRGFGDPITLTVDFEGSVVAAFTPSAEKYLVASTGGYGFVVEAQKIQAQTKTGKQILNLAKDDVAAFAVPAYGDKVMASAASGKFLVFEASELPEMNRGKGVKLINLKDSELEDICVFNSFAGLGLKNEAGTRDKVFTAEELVEFVGRRAQVGKNRPHGYAKGLMSYLPELDEDKQKQANDALDAYLVEEAKKAEEAAKNAEKASVNDLVKAMAKSQSESEEEEPDLFSLMVDDEEKE